MPFKATKTTPQLEGQGSGDRPGMGHDSIPRYDGRCATASVGLRNRGIEFPEIRSQFRNLGFRLPRNDVRR
jgi:hypothetical protein